MNSHVWDFHSGYDCDEEIKNLQVYCFGPGPRTGAFECAAQSSSPGFFVEYDPSRTWSTCWKSVIAPLAHATPSSNR